MAYQQKINFYKIRSFSQKLNATIEFIRQNFKPLGRAIIYIVGPLAILNGLLLAQYFNFIFGNLNGENIDSFRNPLAFVFNPSYIGFLILSVVSGLLSYSVVINYMRLYHEKYPEEITVTEVLNVAWKDILTLFGLVVIGGILVAAGIFALIIPAIYLSIVLSLSVPALFFERNGVFEAIGRSFKLIKGKWWSTFGLVFAAYLLAQAVAMIFIIPFYVFYFLGIFTMVEEMGVTADVSSWWFQAGMTLSVMFMILGSFLTQSIPIIAVNFQYFNLVERQESVGLMGEIEQLDSEN
jgi:hypothetical protein